MVTLEVETRSRQEMVRITRQLVDLVQRSGWRNGLCLVFVPHTTAGITINENADPDVLRDMVYALEKIVPTSDPNYRHAEGNSAAHVKASLMGFSQTLMVRDGRLALGQWQDLLFCEFDGPRHRQLMVEFVPGA
ncbi:MAG: secondary thiamine-phosphate synthase enzyme YjbQ [Chloroflexi bacterium]|nr:secondary thiamine-phosphate synthase enzyme YjbQ [Chloroflexota bacterium]